jgi:hypothetical protein
MTTCPNCPPGYDCETGNYSYDDFEEIRDEQKARLAVCRYPECECDRDHPCGDRLAAEPKETP